MDEDIKYCFPEVFVKKLLTGMFKNIVNYNVPSNEFLSEERRIKMGMLMEVIRMIPAFSESEYIKGYIDECYQSDRKASEFLEDCEENCLKQFKNGNIREAHLTRPFFSDKTREIVKIAIVRGIVETLIEMHKEEEKRIEKERTATIATTAAEKNIRIQGWKDKVSNIVLALLVIWLTHIVIDGEIKFAGKTYFDFKQSTIQPKQGP